MNHEHVLEEAAKRAIIDELTELGWKNIQKTAAGLRAIHVKSIIPVEVCVNWHRDSGSLESTVAYFPTAANVDLFGHLLSLNAEMQGVGSFQITPLSDPITGNCDSYMVNLSISICCPAPWGPTPHGLENFAHRIGRACNAQLSTHLAIYLKFFLQLAEKL